MPYSKRRYLPHWDPEDAALFITWRLHGSLPAPPPEWERLPAGRHFVAMDRALDRRQSAPHWLKEPAVAQCFLKTFPHGSTDLRLYDLRACVIMSFFFY